MNLFLHEGLGDHIICNGMVRYFYEKYNAITLFCLSHITKNIAYMYRDLKNFNIISYCTYSEIQAHIKKNNIEHIKIGFDELNKYAPPMAFDLAFYRLANLDFSIRFNKFHFQRDFDKELFLMKKLNPINQKYIFVHDDPDLGFNIDLRKLNTKYKIIKNDKDFLIFDYITLLENAEEVHFMQSAFKELLCSYVLPKPILYQHNYVRNYPLWLNSSGLNKIIEIH